MQILMKQHGRMIVLCAAAALVFGILFFVRVDGKTGFIEIAYGKAMQDTVYTDVSSCVDVGIYQAVTARRRPEIFYTHQKILPKTAVDIKAAFSAKDADGNSAAIEITDILDASDKSVLYRSKEDRKCKRYTYDTEEFVFPASGIYSVQVTATDAEKKTVSRKYKIPVTCY